MTELKIYCKEELSDEVITLDIGHHDNNNIELFIARNHEPIDDIGLILINNDNIPLLILQLQTLLNYTHNLKT
jgi:hypothetical protein